MPTTFRPGPETRDADYPFVLTTGRVLEHWHTGAMTRHAPMLDAIAPLPLVTLHPDDARGARRRRPARRSSWRRGTARCGAIASVSPEVQRGQIFMAFAYWEAAANRLTGDALDPFGKIPGFKVTAATVRSAPAGAGATASG